MTKDEAIALQKKIQELCQRHEQWVNVTYENKHTLKMIRLEISIKVDR